MSEPTVDVLAVLDRKRSPFRDTGMRRMYDTCVSAYKSGNAGMARGAGNSAATMFWRGFDGSHVGKWDAASRRSLAYAQFRAGQDCAEDTARAAVAALIVREQAQRELLAEILDGIRAGASPQLHAGLIRDLLAIALEARRHV